MSRSVKPKRSLTTPHLVHTIKSSLPASRHASIDAALKALKASSRRLQTAFALLNDELRILERLYYKGKNQHRSALFWKRVLEVRRYSRRLSEISLLEVVESFRLAFFGELGNQQ
jgi:hypothetical protein